MRIRKTIDNGRGERTVLFMLLDGEFHEWASDYVNFDAALPVGYANSLDACAEYVLVTRNNVTVLYEPVEEESTK